MVNIHRVLFVTLGRSTDLSQVGESFVQKLAKLSVVECLESTRPVLDSPLRLVVDSLTQAVRTMAFCDNYDCVISRGAVIGILVSAMTRMFRKRTRHVILSIGLSYLVRTRFRWLVKIALPRLVGASDIVLCHSTHEVTAWKRAGHNSSYFIPLSFDVSDGSWNAYVEGNYIFSGGRADRDYNSLLGAVRGLQFRVVLAIGRNPINGRYDFDCDTLPDNVEVMRDVTPMEFDRLMRMSMLVVLPLRRVSYNVGQTVLVKALLFGKPVIASWNPGVLDYISDGVNGLTFPPGDSRALRGAIQHVLNNEEARRDMGRRARILALNMCESESVMDSFRRILSERGLVFSGNSQPA